MDPIKVKLRLTRLFVVETWPTSISLIRLIPPDGLNFATLGMTFKMAKTAYPKKLNRAETVGVFVMILKKIDEEVKKIPISHIINNDIHNP